MNVRDYTQHYLNRLDRIHGIDSNGARELVNRSPYSLADFAYASVEFVAMWANRLGVTREDRRLTRPDKTLINIEHNIKLARRKMKLTKRGRTELELM